MRSANVNGVKLYFRLAGPETGPALVFINSLGTDWRVWEPVVECLKHRYRVLLHDKRGHGLSDLPQAGMSIEEYARDLAALLDRLAIAGAVLCGLSVGGMIALALAHERPDLARALVLCDTGYRIGTPESWNQRIDAVNSKGMDVIADSVVERWFTANFHRRQATETALWRNMLVRTPATGYTATCAAIRDADLTHAASAIALPTLCMCGSDDRSTPPDLVRELAAWIPGGRYHELPGAAHLPSVETPEALAESITGFIEEHNIG